jgi:hypothetical protein
MQRSGYVGALEGRVQKKVSKGKEGLESLLQKKVNELQLLQKKK